MAEFLIYAKSNTHSDKEKEAAGCYQRGDIVVVMPDGHPWGAQETLPTFFVLKIPGLDYLKARQFTESHRQDTGLLDRDGQKIIKTLRRRAFSLDVANIPRAIKNQLEAGSVTVNWNQARDYFQDRINGGSLSALSDEGLK